MTMRIRTRGRGAVTVATIALLGLLLGGPAQAQWKWRDAAGRITVSDLPPPRDIAERDILQRPEAVLRRAAPPSAAASASPGGAPAGATAAAVPNPNAGATPAVDPELEARKRAAEQAQDAKAKADAERVAAQQRENCGRARAHLAALDSGQRMARTNEKGEREILDDKARADEARRARGVMASECR